MIMQTHPCREPQEALFALIRKDEIRTVSYEQPQEEYKGWRAPASPHNRKHFHSLSNQSVSLSLEEVRH